MQKLVEPSPVEKKSDSADVDDFNNEIAGIKILQMVIERAERKWVT